MRPACHLSPLHELQSRLRSLSLNALPLSPVRLFFNFILVQPLNLSVQPRSPSSPSPSLPDLVPDFTLLRRNLPVKGGGWERGRTMARSHVRRRSLPLLFRVLTPFSEAQFFQGDSSGSMPHRADRSAPVRSTAPPSEIQLRRRLAAVQAELHRLSCAQKALCWQLQSLQQPEPSPPAGSQVRSFFLPPFQPILTFLLLGTLNAAIIAPLQTTLSHSAPCARFLINSASKLCFAFLDVV